MHRQLRGAPVRDEIEKELIVRIEALNAAAVTPTVATFRIGEDDGEKYYEDAIHKRAAKYGIAGRRVVFEEGIAQEEAEEALRNLNDDPSVHGIILLMPFPSGIDGERLRAILDPQKDIDAITDSSYADLFAAKENAFYACTAESCMEILRFHDIPLKGRKVTIVGRSLRVGKPLLLMMMNAHATVTVCHTRTRKEDLQAACSGADIVVLASGQIEGYGPELFRDGQIIVDVGTGVGRDGKMAGDFDAKALEACGTPEELAYTPVPGGVGTVTTTLLLRNVVKAAER